VAAVGGGGGGGGARSLRHRVSVAVFRSPSTQVLATRWRRRRGLVVRSDAVAGGAAAAAAGDSTRPLSGIQLAEYVKMF
jgi:1-acyl-sn-glycerol-3-phosphate acyltransferase